MEDAQMVHAELLMFAPCKGVACSSNNILEAAEIPHEYQHGEIC